VVVHAVPLTSSVEPVLVVEHLTRSYPPQRRGGERRLANSDLSLTVRPGEVVALLGPNGAGKSTFLKQLCGQLAPTSGTISVAGIDMVAHPQRAKEFLSCVPQECHPLDNLNVEEHVRYFGRLKGTANRDSAAEVDRVLERLDLTKHRHQLIRELSGGYKRRVLIAVALAGPSARLLLLDEPTTGLDPEGRRSVWAAVDALRAERRAIVLTTHYIEEAEQLADRVLIIRDGRFVVQGTVDEVRHTLPHGGRRHGPDVERLSAGARAEVEALTHQWHRSLVLPHLWRFDVPDPFASATVAELARLTSLGVRASLAPVSLEDVYLAAVGGPEES
jgi:ABC-2 type transport system ATP-binding protein